MTAVLLLRPLSPERTVMILPAVDPVTEPAGAKGVVVAEILSVKPDSIDAFSQQAESAFAAYRDAGVREAGVLVTLDAPNNFPPLPVRTDGPYRVWLGVVENEKSPETKLNPLTERSQKTLFATGLLRSKPEVVILDRAPGSRLRWISDAAK